MNRHIRALVMVSMAALGLLLSASVMAQPVKSTNDISDAADGGFAIPPGATLLYDQLVDFGGSAITSQNFEAGLDAFDNQAADDFTTGPDGWDVTHVDVAGVYYNGPGPASSVSVWFFDDAAGSPGAAVCTYAGIPYVDPFGQSGNFEIELPTECELAGSTTYWVSVQINMAFGAGGQWGWAEVATQFGNASVWQNPGNGFGSGCTTWGTRAACSIQFTGPDLAFALLGRQNVSRATFDVQKAYNDGNEAPVDVMLTCNTGLPLEQPATIAPGDGVNFVVVDYEDETMDCTVVETAGSDGYTVSYFNGETVSDEGCSYEDVPFGAAFSCLITNTLDQVEVEVTKEWIDENPQFAAINLAEASWSCTNVAQGSSYGWLEFFGTTDTRSFFVYPDWEFGTDCDITEVEIADGGVEIDDSDCQNIELFPGDSASCTIVNTRLYEGIPTLSQYGLAVLALMMLGMGFVAFRRIA